MNPDRGEDKTVHGSAPARPRRVLLLLLVALAALAADFLTKEIALARFSPQDPVVLLGGLLKLTLIFNPGAAFSIGTGYTWFFSLVMIGVIVYILSTARKLRSVGWGMSLGLILGGASGNLVDRLFRPPSPLHGHVVDWIQVPNWPVFNIADSCIVVGGILAVLLAFRGINLDGTRESDGEEDQAEATRPPAQGEAGGRGAEDTAEGSTSVRKEDGRE
ncbi:signal peptidase II [Marinactinospora thermotolerans]|uniref:Lipoprotein signal peptidase n=1 Tax=Marinactinospora thermotolerans DSM 45154 TaxID=1122192 RepID=A0A1T4KUZ6_9ACTN|nr:signal peptidase II [Marinactinospora thermotolerans]SJZ46241.1 signal peptidase II Aspartic peptidase. MEROPS family A08 [Marinactinospora thermotolerans DSM 45154]